MNVRINRRCAKPSVDQLESRSLLSALTITVNSLLDDPSGPVKNQTTLRDAIGTANASPKNSYTIKFNVDGTIALTQALPNLVGNITIQGPGATKLTVNAVETTLGVNNDSTGFSVFTVNSGSKDTISG